MTMKSILASLAACAIGVSAMALTASAEVSNGNQTGDDGSKFYMVDVKAEGVALSSVYGLTVEMTIADLSNGSGGGLGLNSPSTGWISLGEWANEGTNKPIQFDANGDFTYLSENAFFVASEDYAQIWLQNWWGGDVVIDKVTLLDKDGKALSAGVTTTTALATTTTSASTTTTTTTSSDTTTTTTTTMTTTAATAAADATSTTAAASTATGDAGIALAAAGLTLAGAAAYVARKKH